MEKENQRIIITKRIFKEALVRILKKKTVDKVTVTELCKEAGINRATFYRHYSVPVDILTEIEEDITAGAAYNKLPSSVKELEEYVKHLCSYLDENADMIRLLIKNKSDYYLSFLIKKFYEVLLKLKDYNEGLGDLDEDSLELISSYLAGGSYYMLRRWITGEINKTPKEMAEIITHLALKSGNVKETIN